MTTQKLNSPDDSKGLRLRGYLTIIASTLDSYYKFSGGDQHQ